MPIWPLFMCMNGLPPAWSAEPINPDFSAGLSGWQVIQEGGHLTPGEVLPVTAGARLVDGDSLLVRLEQAFLLDADARELSFTVTPDPAFDTVTTFIPDTFEARLVDDLGRPTVAPWDPASTAFFNLQEDGEALRGPGTAYDGARVTVSLADAPRDRPVTLVFSLVANDTGHTTSIRVGPISIRHDNRPPVAVAGLDMSAECGVPFTLDATPSSDPDGDALTWLWTEGGMVVGTDPTLTLQRSAGTWTFVLTVTDPSGASSTDEVVVRVHDTTPPTLLPVDPVEVEVDAACAGVVPDLTDDVSATDACLLATLTQDPPAGTPLALGATQIVELLATDAVGLSATREVAVTLVDPTGACSSIDTDTDGVVVDTTLVDSDSDTDGPPVLVDTSLESPPVDTDSDAPVETDTPPVDTDLSDTPVDSDLPDTAPKEDTDIPSEPVGPPDDKTGGECGCRSVTSPAVLLPMLALAGLRRRRSSRRSITALVLLWMSFSAHAATPLLLDEVVDGTLLAGDATATWEVDVPPGTRVYGDALAASGAGQTSWSVIDRFGRVVARSTSFVDLPAMPLMGGRYSVVVSRSDGLDGTVQFRLGRAPIVHQGQAAPGQEIAGTVASAGERHTWTVDASAGTLLGIDLLEGDSAHLALALADAAGRVLLSSLRDTAPIALAGGTYTLTIDSNHRATGAGGTGPYRLLLADATGEAGAITLGSPLVGAIDTPWVIDTWSLTLATDDRISFDVINRGRLANLGWTLTDEAGFEVIRGAAMTDQGPVALARGAYALRVYGDTPRTDSYEMMVASVHDFDRTAAIGDVVDLVFSAAAETARISFDARQGQVLVIDPTVDRTDWTWSLRDPEGEAVQPAAADLQFGGPFVLSAGTWVLEVSPGFATTRDAQLRLVEPAHIVEPVSLGDVFSGGITGAGDTVTYRFAAAAGQVVNLLASSVVNGGNLSFEITDGLGRTIVAPTSSLVTRTGISLAGGEYALDVRGERDALGSWTLQLVDAGSSSWVASGTPVSLGEAVNGSLPAPATPQTWTLALADDTSIYVERLSGSGTLTWKLVDPAGTPVFGPVRAPASGSGPHALQAGTYTLELTDPSSGSAFGFRFTEVAADLMGVGALDTITSEAFTTPGELHAWQLDITTPTRVYVDLLAGGSQLYWTLLDPAGQPRYDERADSLQGSDLGPIDLSPGSWTLLLQDRGGATPAYSFNMRTVVDQSAVASVGDTLTGVFTTPGSTWTWWFDAPGAGQVLFDRYLGSSWEWSLIDPSGVTRWGPTDDDGGSFPLIAGAWSVVIDPLHDAVPEYGLTLVPTWQTSSVAALDQEIAAAGYTDHVVDLAVRTRVFVDVLDASHSRLTLLDPAGVPVFPEDSMRLTEDHGPFDLEPGTYTVHTSGTDPWRLVLRTVNDLDGVATLGREVVGEIPGPGAMASYDFTLGLDGMEVSGDLTDGAPAMSWRLVDPLGWPVWDWRPATGPLDDLPPLRLATGTYHIDLDHPGDVVDDHAFVVRAAVPGSDPGFCDPLLQPDGADCDGDGITDMCQVADLPSLDCDRDGSLDVCDMEDEADCDLDGRPDGCVDCPQVEVVFLLDTSDSMLDETVPLCDSLPLAIDQLEARGLSTSATVLGIADAPAAYPCIAGDARAMYPELPLPLAPPPPLDGYGGCIGFFYGNPTEDWGRAVAVVAARHPWTPGALRVIVPVADEGPYCGDDITAEDYIALDYLIQVANLYDVRVSPAAGLGTGDDTLDLMRATAAATLGSLQRTSSDVGPWVEAISTLTLDSCAAFHDCNDNDVPDSCEIADGLAVDCACDRVPSTCGCDGPPLVDEVQPVGPLTLPPGGPLVISGRAISTDTSRRSVAVLVDGGSVESLDAAGRFYSLVTVQPGPQTFRITALDHCGERHVDVAVTGDPGASGDLTGLEDMTAALDADFRRTTWSTATGRLAVEVAAVNTGDSPIPGPLLMAVGPDLFPTTELVSAHGLTSTGLPYVEVLPSEGALAPAATSAYTGLLFEVPDRQQVLFTPRWLVPAQHAPRYTSVPSVYAWQDRPWSYQATASDPALHALGWWLIEGPLEMTLDDATGALAWTPGPADLGAHAVRLRVDDGFGGHAEQAFTLTVRALDPNSPPRFLSAPSPRAAIGAPWLYAPVVEDPDGDTLTFTLEEGPAGMTFEATAGIVRWPDPVTGSWAVALRVDDGRGGRARQRWTLVAGALADHVGAPQILSLPPLVVTAGDLFVYQPVATDPDGDVLTWEKRAGPTHLGVDALTGRASWAPAAPDVGAHPIAVAVRDPDGNEAEQAWTLTVAASSPNGLPTFSSLPGRTAVAGIPWSYDAEASDPDGDPLSYTLRVGPPGMVADPVLGLLTWTPGPADAGEVPVAVQARDDRGGMAEQAFHLVVRAENGPPSITSGEPRGGVPDVWWTHDVNAFDPEGDALTFHLLRGPPGSTISAWSGLVSWLPAEPDIGSHELLVEVRDAWGGVAQGSWIIDVAPDGTAPTVSVLPAADGGCVDAPLQVCVRASDDVGVASVSLDTDGVPELLGPDGCATVTRTSAGPVELAATAVDHTGNVGADLLVVIFADCADAQPPTVNLVSAAPGAVLRVPTDVVVDIDDNTPETLSWTLEISPRGEEIWTQLGAGLGPLASATAAVVDTTSLANGDYDLKLRASDGPNFTELRWWYAVAGEYKLGHYRISFTDVLVDLAGIPMVVSRNYDSLDTRPGDFGAGWTLGMAGGVWDTPAETYGASTFIDALDEEPFTVGMRVTVARPDGVRVGFTFQPFLTSTALIAIPTWQPDPGVDDTLTAEGPTAVLLAGGRAWSFVTPYNPSRFTLTTRDKVAYTFDEQLGLVRVVDASGNTVDVDASGLHHSAGPSVTFERDDQGRISRIVEPDYDPADGVDPAAHGYAYDPLGNLASYASPLGHATTFRYEAPLHPHHLSGIDDPLGRPMMRTVYGDDGRTIATCPGDADPVTLEGCTRFEHDTISAHEAVYDAAGYRSDYIWDEAGHLAEVLRWLDDGTALSESYTWDELGRLVVRTANGATWSWTYDDLNRKTSKTDPNGAVWTWTYDGDCHGWSTQTDPLGDLSRATYDERCHKLTETDPLGATTTHHYDERGLDLGWTNPMGDRWTMAYDELGRLISRTDAVGHTRTWTWDERGDRVADHKPNGDILTIAYDEAHQLIEERWNDAAGHTNTYAWDALGRLERLSDGTTTITRTYDVMGRVATETVDVPGGPGSWTLAYAYDARGLVAAVTDSFGGTTSYGWDGARRMLEVAQSGPGVVSKQVTWAYTPWDQPSLIQRFVGGVASATSELTYDRPDHQRAVRTARHTDPAGSVIDEVTWSRDLKGQVTGFTDADGPSAVVMDGAGRIAKVDRPEGGPLPDELYQYNANGERTGSHRSVTHVYGRDLGTGSDELMQDDAWDYFYDASGRMIGRCTRLDRVCDDFTWDHRDLLVSLVRRDAGGTVLGTWSFTYDPVTRMTSWTHDGEVTWVVHDGANPVLDVDSAGEVQTRRLYRREIDSLLGEELDGQATWAIVDPVGTVRVVVGAAGQVMGRTARDVFGGQDGSDADGSYGFQGRSHLVDTNLSYFRFRHYSSNDGRFITRDELEPFGFAFADGNPIHRVDPLGLSTMFQYAKVAVLGCVTGGAIGAFAQYLWFSEEADYGKGILKGCAAGAGLGLKVGIAGKVVAASPWVDAIVTALAMLVAGI